MNLAQRLQIWWVVLPALTLLALSYWWLQLEDGKVEATLPATGPDAVMERFFAVKLNAQGQAEYMLSAEQMSYFNKQRAELTAPRLSFMPPDGQPALHIIATRGTVLQEKNDVQFFDNIEVLREATTEHPELRVQTEYLHILPDQGIAETDKPVHISDANNQIDAVGLKFDQKARTFTLLSQVRSQHVFKH